MSGNWIPCAECGKMIQQTNGLRKYCPSCIQRHQTESSRKAKCKAQERKKAGAKLEVRYCTICGKKLPAGSHTLRKYCDHCRAKVNLDAARERGRKKSAAEKAAREAAHLPAPGRGKHKKVNKPCRVCGKMLYGVDPGTYYCPDCKANLYKAQAEPKKAEPKSSHEKIVDDNAAAIAKGMTYGQYKQWQRRQKELMERGEKVEE